MKASDLSLIKRFKSTTHAIRGIHVLIKTTPNFWVHYLTAAILVVLGFLFEISHIEWMLLILANGMVIVAEAINTAIEVDIDLTSPDYHPFARDTKDIAAGAVLIAAVVAYLVDAIIFLKKVIELIQASL